MVQLWHKYLEIYLPGIPEKHVNLIFFGESFCLKQLSLHCFQKVRKDFWCSVTRDVSRFTICRELRKEERGLFGLLGEMKKIEQKMLENLHVHTSVYESTILL